jgi:hypothetical protein
LPHAFGSFELLRTFRLALAKSQSSFNRRQSTIVGRQKAARKVRQQAAV